MNTRPRLSHFQPPGWPWGQSSGVRPPAGCWAGLCHNTGQLAKLGQAWQPAIPHAVELCHLMPPAACSDRSKQPPILLEWSPCCHCCGSDSPGLPGLGGGPSDLPYLGSLMEAGGECRISVVLRLCHKEPWAGKAWAGVDRRRGRWGGGAAGTLPGYPAGVGTMLWPGGVSTRPGPIWLLRCALAWAGGFMTGHVE